MVKEHSRFANSYCFAYRGTAFFALLVANLTISLSEGYVKLLLYTNILAHDGGYCPPRIEVNKLSMDITNKARIQWACRRGMRELDISIMPFFKYEYDQLDDLDKKLFIRLLESDDPDLFNWLMNHGSPQDSELQRMVTLIQTRNKDRGPVEM